MTELNVFPNPASAVVNLSIPTNQEITNLMVTDISGRIVLNGETTRQIDVGLLNSGLYFVVAKTSQTTYSGRFIKK